MKKMLRLFGAAALLAAVFACGPDEPQQPETPPITVSVSPSSLSFAAENAPAQSVSVQSNGSWRVVPGDSWFTVTPLSGNGSGSLQVSVNRNASGARTAVFTVTGTDGKNSAAVTVTQAGYVAPQPEEVVPVPVAFDGNKRSSTTYQILIYGFADSNNDGVGDFKGIISKLDYLEAMGVTAVWLSPAHPTSSYHAYDVNDYGKVNPLYGTEKDFKDLVAQCHAKDIEVYMDFVINHSGNAHPWFTDAASNPESPYRDYYIFSSDPQADVAAGKIAMLKSEGANAYQSGEWYPCGAVGRYKFKLDWSSASAPKVTVTATKEAPFTGSSGKYLYFGNNVLKEFKSVGGNVYELVVDFNSTWGFLVRTSNSSWAAGTKYGSPAGSRKALRLGQAFTLQSNSSNDPGNVPFAFYHSNFAESMPDLNYGAVATAETSPAFVAVAEAADHWIRDCGVDGFRLDAVKHIYHNQTSDENPAFLKKWYDRCNATFRESHDRDIFMVGEVLDGHNVENNYYKGLPSLFEFGFRDQVLGALKNGNGASFAPAVTGFIRDHKGNNAAAETSLIIGNHDISRVASELGKDLAKEKQAAAMLLTAEGRPFIFQGDELGYWGDKSRFGDEDIRQPMLWNRSGSDCARKGLPNGVDASMLSGSISVEAQEADAGSLLNVYKDFSRLRNSYPALANGTMSTTSLSGTTLAAWYMSDGSQKLLVIHNVSASEVSVTVEDKMDKPVALLGTAKTLGKTLTIGARSSVVFQIQ